MEYMEDEIIAGNEDIIQEIREQVVDYITVNGKKPVSIELAEDRWVGEYFPTELYGIPVVKVQVG